MMIRAVTIEREFGCGGSEIARKLAELLGWKLWDRELTEEIARLTGTPASTLKSRFATALARLRIQLEQKGLAPEEKKA